MSARPVPHSVRPHVMYAVMTAEPLDGEDLIAPPSADLLRHYGSSDVAMRKLATRPHQWLLLKETSLELAAPVARDARVEALQLAEQHDGVVVDLTVPRILEMRSEQVSLDTATQWYAVDYQALSSGYVRTHGLDTFGLPEVVVEGVDERQHAMYTAVLAGLVHRLIREWPAQDPVGRATVTLRDIAHGLGDSEAESTPTGRRVEVDISYDADDNRLGLRLLSDPAVGLFAP